MEIEFLTFDEVIELQAETPRLSKEDQEAIDAFFGVEPVYHEELNFNE